MYRHANSKETYLLRVPQFTVQVGKGGNNVIVSNQVIAPYTKLNPKNVQTCPFKGNLLAERIVTASCSKEKLVLTAEPAC